MMDGEMRRIARAKCGRTCPFTTPKPIVSGCNHTASGGCRGHLKCVTMTDGTWSQCVDCGRHFSKDCQKLNHDMRLAAILACKKTCQDTMCEGEEWCPGRYKCIGNSKWAQCLRCDSKTFNYRCQHWKPDFRHIAERRCHRKCATR